MISGVDYPQRILFYLAWKKRWGNDKLGVFGHLIFYP